VGECAVSAGLKRARRGGVRMQVVDAHLDLSYNALSGRDVLLPARQQVPDAEGIPTVGLPDLRAGGVSLVCATVFLMPSINGKPGYRNADEAHDEAMRHLAWYRRQSESGQFHFVKSRGELAQLATRKTGDAQEAILLLEGADAIRTPADVGPWFDAGLRIVGLAWKQTRYAGGTGAPGPLTAAGVELVHELERAGILHDVSHLAEDSFWQLLAMTEGPMLASHSNCRAIVPTDRQLSDAMIRALVDRGGVIGMNLYDRFLLPPGEYGKRRATLADVVRHVRHICDLAGNANHVAIGTDMDGGLGRNEIPIEIETSGDLPRISEALRTGGFTDAEVAGIMSENWRRFFASSLPT